METINDRIKIILEKSEMTKTAFGEILKVSQQYISKLIKTGNPSDRLIEDICEKIIIDGKTINEEWLRNGTGKMFTEVSKEDEYSRAAAEIVKNGDIYAMDAIIKYWKLDPSSKTAIWNFVRSLASYTQDNLSTDSSITAVAEEEAHGLKLVDNETSSTPAEPPKKQKKMPEISEADLAAIENAAKLLRGETHHKEQERWNTI